MLLKRAFAKYGNCIIESWYQKIVELPVLQCCFIPAVIVVSWILFPFRGCDFMSKTWLLGSHCSSNLLEESVRAWLTEWDHYISSVGTPKIIGYRLQGLPPWVWVVERVHVGKWIEHGWFIATKPMSSSMLIRDPSQKRHFTTASFILVEDLWSIAQIVGVLGRFWIFFSLPLNPPT